MPTLRTPLPSLALLKARDALLDSIQNFDQSLGEEAARAVKAWHLEVQNYADGDTLKNAFEEGRLTFRTMSHTGGKRFDFGTKDTARERVLGLINNDDYYDTVNDEAVQKPGHRGVWVTGKQFPKSEQRNVRIDAGAAGIVRRGTPENFVTRHETGRSRKFDLGLHDLSASLLNPEGYTLKGYSDANLIVLMPLPLPLDVRLFSFLRDLSKSVPSAAAFKSAVEIVATQFTRPRIASSLDMGAKYRVAKSERHGGDSVKYVKGRGPAVTSKEPPETCRKNARENYRGILMGESKANEITIAYRRYGTKNLFPIFGLTAPGSKQYKEVRLVVPELETAFVDYELTGSVIDAETFEIG